MSPELKDFIDRKLVSAIARNSSLKNELISLTCHMPLNSTVSERLYILSGGKKPTCNNGNEYKWNNNLAKYVACGRTSECSCAKNCQISKLVKNEVIKCIKNDDTKKLLKSYDFKLEQELYDFLSTIDKVVVNDVGGIEFQIRNVKIYFYNFRNIKDKNFCDDFRKASISNGYRNIVIFEDEFVNKGDIVRSRLKYIIDKNKKLCGARDTAIKFIDSADAKRFLNDNHIQGYSNCTYKIGAFYKDELVSVMTFGKTRHFMGRSKISDTYELIRFSSKHNIPGVASKLLAFFKKNVSCNRIETYCDLRWGTGNVYEKMGFNGLPSSTLGYWYVKDSKRYYRYNFCKQKLIEKGYDRNKSESTIMKEIGYDKIYDCGNLKYFI